MPEFVSNYGSLDTPLLRFSFLHRIQYECELITLLRNYDDHANHCKKQSSKPAAATA